MMVHHKPTRRQVSSLPSPYARRKYDIDPLVRLAKEIESSGSIRKGAAKIGVSPAYLSDLMHKRREPGEKVLKFLGLKKVVKRSVWYEEVEKDALGV